MMSDTVTAVLVPSDPNKPLQALKLPRDTAEAEIQERLCCHGVLENVVKTLLLRPCTELKAGLYAYQDPAHTTRPNLRATRLSMACGIFPLRFYGDVILWSSKLSGQDEQQYSYDLAVEHVALACCKSPDLRSCILCDELSSSVWEFTAVPEWLKIAAKNNYHDGAVLAKLASAMKGSHNDEDSFDSELEEAPPVAGGALSPNSAFVTKVPLCLHCRRPASTLCPDCEGVYFCETPRTCRQEGWSHDCLCSTYQLYTKRRSMLSECNLGDWHRHLVSRIFQQSDTPYEEFLESLGIHKETAQNSWWRTEMDGWSGGHSDSAKQIDVSIRRSYKEGFYPIKDGIPEEGPIDREIAAENGLSFNKVGLFRIRSWTDYYKLRGLPHTSTAALLLSFPLTLYYCIVEYGEVPCTVARMLQRPLRIHIVGAEKELNFIDLFREVSFILPENISLELVFVVRHDMLPKNVRSAMGNKYQVKLSDRMHITLISGTYGDSLDPNFDCGGSPDMMMAFNAGLYAYESWRSVVTYLDQNSGVVGVFTDYNEFSGVQCASLGGSASRESVCMNPFRQPRAMPVLSMNLPQFSNGFIYVFNQQSLE